jgi:hypothetical protein
VKVGEWGKMAIGFIMTLHRKVVVLSEIDGKRIEKERIEGLQVQDYTGHKTYVHPPQVQRSSIGDDGGR